MSELPEKVQLHNAVELLERGYDAQDDVETLLEKYGTVDDVPEADQDGD